MNWRELDKILKKIDDKQKNNYESTRLIMYSVFQSQSTKKISPTDIMKFDWDNEKDNIIEQQPVNTDIENINKIIKIINK